MPRTPSNICRFFHCVARSPLNTKLVCSWAWGLRGWCHNRKFYPLSWYAARSPSPLCMDADKTGQDPDIHTQGDDGNRIVKKSNFLQSRIKYSTDTSFYRVSFSNISIVIDDSIIEESDYKYLFKWNYILIFYLFVTPRYGIQFKVFFCLYNF